MSSLTISHLVKSYGGAAPALRGIDLAVAEGEFVVLLGPSGCGKSTTLRLLAGLESPTAGQIEFGDRVVADPQRRINVPPNKRDVGLVFQSYALWPHLSVIDNVAYPLRSAKVGKGSARAQALEFLDLVGLRDYANRPSMSLSGGQQQRVALARALVSKPVVLLLDEPLSNLDATLRVVVRSELRRVHRETARTTIHVTHDQAEAFALADRVVLMNHGVVEQIATPQELFDHPATPFAAGFVGFENLLHGRVDAGAAGAARVSIPGAGSLLVDGGGPSAAAARPASVAFRARDAAIVAPGEERDTLTGTVVDAIYTGGGHDVHVVAGEHRVTVSLPGAAAGLPEVGEAVAIRVDPTRSRLYLTHPDPTKVAAVPDPAAQGEDPRALVAASAG